MSYDGLMVATMYSNPCRTQVRPRLYKDFARYIDGLGADLWTVEVAFGGRPFEVTEATNPRHLQLRSDYEFFCKENALNLLVQRFPASWEAVAWVDGDVTFTHPNPLNEIREELRHNPVVQCFREAVDVGPDQEFLKLFKGFAYLYREGRLPTQVEDDYDYGQFGHTGYAWAMTREAWDTVGGLVDFAILGSADRHMCLGLIGQALPYIPPGVHPGYLEQVRIWQERAKALKGHVGYVDTTLIHQYHGPKRARNYRGRWDYLIRNQFDPEYDLKRDWQGLYLINPGKPQLKRDCQDYFFSRDEDDIRVG
jgi:hypothetical protein